MEGRIRPTQVEIVIGNHSTSASKYKTLADRETDLQECSALMMQRVPLSVCLLVDLPAESVSVLSCVLLSPAAVFSWKKAKRYCVHFLACPDK